MSSTSPSLILPLLWRERKEGEGLATFWHNYNMKIDKKSK
jgi:hypothetical protein